jgi:protein tyrosine phosphatase (PTP) superfamily phosphohydrolase (DUF442 family)
MLFSRLSDDERYRRRMARADRWDKPITTDAERRRAWWNMVLVDHGIFRIAYLNLHKVTQDLWRAAQPTPKQIADLGRQGVKTIVNLRGGREFGSWPLEKEACEAAGIALEELTARSREAPSVEMIREAKTLFDRIEYPALIHCKSGADRAGVVAALYLLLKEGADADTALKQLSPYYGHWRWSKTGVLDAFIQHYRDEGEAKGLSLIEWAETAYDPAALQAEFKPHAFSNFVVEKILRRE